ncbi:hypothetical protein ACIBFB_07210 [Nocardiopsis sp. NPDC050513]|uniref:hypothetical protein n=1 Tax=Nocardiopsis sp. NPDC050513 TaxID=3364338 RepID=UPI00379D6356
MDIDQLAFYVFFLTAAVIAGNSFLRIRQRGLFDAGLGVRNEGTRRRQNVASAALRVERELIDRKERVVEALANDTTVPDGTEAIAEEHGLRRELEALNASFEERRTRADEELERIDAETEEELARYRRRRRTALAADAVLLVLSVAAMVALVAAALPLFS